MSDSFLGKPIEPTLSKRHQGVCLWYADAAVSASRAQSFAGRHREDWQENASPAVAIYLTRIEVRYAAGDARSCSVLGLFPLHGGLTRNARFMPQVLAKDDPVLLLAHAWAQYAALLAGEAVLALAKLRMIVIAAALHARLRAEASDGDAACRRADHTEDGAPRAEIGHGSWHCSLFLPGVVFVRVCTSISADS